MHIITVIMLLRETAPPRREDLNLGLPGKGGCWLGGPTATSEPAALGVQVPCPAYLSETGILGFIPVKGLKPLSGALGTRRDAS